MFSAELGEIGQFFEEVVLHFIIIFIFTLVFMIERVFRSIHNKGEHAVVGGHLTMGDEIVQFLTVEVDGFNFVGVLLFAVLGSDVERFYDAIVEFSVDSGMGDQGAAQDVILGGRLGVESQG